MSAFCTANPQPVIYVYIGLRICTHIKYTYIYTKYTHNNDIYKYEYIHIYVHICIYLHVCTHVIYMYVYKDIDVCI